MYLVLTSQSQSVFHFLFYMSQNPILILLYKPDSNCRQNHTMPNSHSVVLNVINRRAIQQGNRSDIDHCLANPVLLIKLKQKKVWQTVGFYCQEHSQNVSCWMTSCQSFWLATLSLKKPKVAFCPQGWQTVLCFYTMFLAGQD